MTGLSLRWSSIRVSMSDTWRIVDDQRMSSLDWYRPWEKLNSAWESYKGADAICSDFLRGTRARRSKWALFPDLCSDEPHETRLTALEAQFPGATVLLHKIGEAGPHLQRIWTQPRLLNIVEQV